MSSGDWVKIPIIMLVIGIPAFYYGLKNYLLMQKIRNTPTSKVRSAAVGLVELSGKAKCRENMPSPISKANCIFWRLKAEYYQHSKNGGHWNGIYGKDSSMQFYLEDETGKMLVDPKGGDIQIPPDFTSSGRLGDKALFGLVSQKQIDKRAIEYMAENTEFARAMNSHGGQELRVTESYIAEGDPLYVLGSAMPLSGASSAISNENLVVRKSDTDKILYIRDTEEKRILDQFKLSVPLGIGGGFLLIMGALIILLLGFNIH